MTDKIESYVEFEQKLTEILQEARRSGLDTAVLTGILLDSRDYIKMRGEVPGIEDE